MADFVGMACRLVDLKLVIGGCDGVDEKAWTTEIKKTQCRIIPSPLGDSQEG